jgi:hypothetical protein
MSMGSQREYAHFKVLHFDFPLNDSLTKIFGADTTPIRIEVTSYVQSGENILNAPVSTYVSTDVVQFNLKRVHTSLDVAN